MNGYDPTRPVAPAFTRLTPHIDISQPGAPGTKKPKSGGLIRNAAMAVALRQGANPNAGGK